jgi:hypothetical protein
MQRVLHARIQNQQIRRVIQEHQDTQSGYGHFIHKVAEYS